MAKQQNARGGRRNPPSPSPGPAGTPAAPAAAPATQTQVAPNKVFTWISAHKNMLIMVVAGALILLVLLYTIPPMFTAKKASTKNPVAANTGGTSGEGKKAEPAGSTSSEITVVPPLLERPPEVQELSAPARGAWSSRIFVPLGKRIIFSLRDADTILIRLDGERVIEFKVSDNLQNLGKFKSIEFQSTTTVPVAIEYYFKSY